MEVILNIKINNIVKYIVYTTEFNSCDACELDNVCRTAICNSLPKSVTGLLTFKNSYLIPGSFTRVTLYKIIKYEYIGIYNSIR